ncbi:MAG: 2-amino-4-hydroxy-6-hydroxymethyldihydropteridine diphosphokinase, partial [Acidobacteria bacterium]|nr:2-amino-4-hydroxy-6-hydroxymethyldihydropteridine diphosphokinase [Acidobacteriota bacterium]
MLVYLSLGSNVGNRAANIANAIDGLFLAGIHVLHRSSLYVTEPVGIREQNWFLNGVIEAETSLMPRQLLHAILKIEQKFGRRRLVRSGPRTIDLDILFYGSSIVR